MARQYARKSWPGIPAAPSGTWTSTVQGTVEEIRTAKDLDWSTDHFNLR